VCLKLIDNDWQCNYNVITYGGVSFFKPQVEIMRASIIKIGNSQGVRIPKPIIEQCGLVNEVELEVHDHELIIRPLTHPRRNWENAFMAMAANGDDKLLDSATITTSSWDEDEWEWK